MALRGTCILFRQLRLASSFCVAAIAKATAEYSQTLQPLASERCGATDFFAKVNALAQLIFAKTRRRPRFHSRGPIQYPLYCVMALIVVCLPSLTLAGQTTLQDMFHKSWTAREGAPSNISDMEVGKDGFIWLATDDGLYRFDGVTFERVPLPPYVKQQAIGSLVQTDDRKLWLGFLLGGLVRIRGTDVRLFTEQDGLRDGATGQLMAIGSAVWLCTNSGPASVVDEKVRYYGKADGLQNPGCMSIFDDAMGNLWVVSLRGVSVRLHGEQSFTLSRSWSMNISCAASKVEGVWCSRLDGKIDHLSIVGGSIQSKTGPGPAGVWSLSVSSDGFLYLGTYTHGFSRIKETAVFDKQSIGRASDTFDVNNGLSGEYVFQSARDAEGSLWVATSNGLDQFRPRRFRPIAVSTNSFATLLSGKRGAQNLVADKRIMDIDTHEVLFAGLKRSPRSLYRSVDGSLWFDSPAGLEHLDGGKVQTVPLPTPQTSDELLGITEDEARHIFISPRQSSVYGLVDGRWLPASAFGLSAGRVITTYHEQSGNAWFGYLNGSAAKLSQGRATAFGVKDGLNLGNIFVFGQVGSTVLAGGTSGVAFLKGDRFYPLTLRGGMTLRGVTGITSTPSHNLWLNTSDGVVEIDDADFKAAFEDPLMYVPFERYSAQDGLIGITHPTLGRGSAWIGPNGLLYIVTRTNFQVADPNVKTVNPIMPQVFVTSATDGTKTSGNGESGFVSSRKPEVINFRYTATSLLDPEKVKFRYRLEGYDRNWLDAGSRRLVSYSHLPPGRYTFHVIACNNSGLWNNSGATMSLEVPATFVQTQLFKVLVATLVICCLIVLFRLRLESAKKLMRDRAQARAGERERIARDLHDSFFPSVEAILLHVHAAIAKLPKGSEVRLVVNEAFEQADTIMSHGRSLIYDLRRDRPEEPLEFAIRGFADSISVDAVPRITISRSGNARGLEPLAVMEILSVTKEALWNALRHASSSNILIEVVQQDRALVVSVTDDGRGIDPEIAEQGHRYGHFGLQGMRERACKLKGSLEISIVPSGGTSVLLRVPASTAYISRIEEFSTRWLSFRTAGDQGKL
jgi:signal transduction histidine kinase/ligand-binding sensor domain-containing protein